ncbi:MAG: hypothetical protein C4300_05205 [Thermus sp.]
MPAPFLNPLVPGLPPAVSAWVRGLEEVEEHLRKWAFELSEEAFWWRPAPGLNPIGGLVRHILGSSHRLLRAGLPGELPEWARLGREWELQGPLEPKELVLERFEAAWPRLVSEFRGLAGEDLARPVRVGQLGAEAPLAHVLHHLVEHAQHHAGQIIYAHKLLQARIE